MSREKKENYHPIENSQNWCFIFSEMSIFKKRYVRIFGTVLDSRNVFLSYHLQDLVTAVIPEKEFIASKYKERGFKEIDIEQD